MSRKKLPKEPVLAHIESLSHEGRGIAHVNDKVVFIEGALPGEEVLFEYRSRRAKFDQGKLLEVVTPSPDRIEPVCRHFAICGGCSLQHLPSSKQLEHKQAVLLEQLARIGKVEPQTVLEPLTGPVQGYRRRARLSARYVDKKQKMLVGFREKHSPFVAELTRCEILHPPVGVLLEPLQHLISGLSIYRRVPQIEVAVADNVTALVLRHLEPFTEQDIQLLRQFEQDNNVALYLQSGGPGSVVPLSPESMKPLSYQLPEHDLEFLFLPTDFIQNNGEMNRRMINLALQSLSPSDSDRVLDLFCGLGNFSLPVARQSKTVCGIEGDMALVERARKNARHNDIDNVEYHCADLADEMLEAAFLHQVFDKLLLDPPRTGAQAVLRKLDLDNMNCVVYVSCNPATLARDAGILVHEKGFRLKQAGVMDMFPHTAHIESIAVFEP